MLLLQLPILMHSCDYFITLNVVVGNFHFIFHRHNLMQVWRKYLKRSGISRMVCE